MEGSDEAKESVDKSPNKADKKEVSKSVIPKLSRKARVFLSIANIAIITILISDLFYFMGMIQEIELPSLAFGNLGVLVLAYFSYVLKRRIRRKMLEARQKIEADRALQEKKDK